MAAHPIFSNTLNVLGLSLTDEERDNMRQAYEKYVAIYEHVHGCVPTKKEFLLTIMSLGMQEIRTVNIAVLCERLKERSL